jgi:hypothetical protein
MLVSTFEVFLFEALLGSTTELENPSFKIET